MSEKTANVLAVRNAAQKVLFEDELKGQISDGFWENAEPQDHFIAWCEAEVIVDPTNVGRNFSVRKDAYAFSHKSLLDVVGDRMFAAVQEKVDPEYTMDSMVADLNDLRKIFKVVTTFAPVVSDVEVDALIAETDAILREAGREDLTVTPKPAPKLTTRSGHQIKLPSPDAAPASVAEALFEHVNRCRGKWSTCGGAYQAKSATWHLCQACTSARALKAK